MNGAIHRDAILITSLYGLRKREGLVELRWGEQLAQLTVDQARRHALGVMEAAAAAEFDELLVEVLLEWGLSLPVIGQLMLAFRERLQEASGQWTDDMPLDVEQLAAIRTAQLGVEKRGDTALGQLLTERYAGRGLALLKAIQDRRAARRS